MNKEQVISDEVLDKVREALFKGENWMVYNNSLYFIDSSNVQFFKTQEDAEEFCQNNRSDYDSFSTLCVQSPEDVIKQVPYGDRLDEYLNNIPALKDLEQLNKNSFTNQSFFMNEQNLQYLKDNIKYLGFGEKLYPELEKNIQQGFPEFQLKIQTEYNQDRIGATLHFKKSDSSDMYFLNRYDATLQKANDEVVSQSIYLNKGQGVTIKEAYNLLNGRSVHKELANKEGEKYQAWIQLDFKQTDNNGNYKIKQFHQNFGYDVEKALANYPIKELQNEQERTRLIESLQKGNRQSVTFIENGNQQKMFIEANPKFKSINVYDSNMQRINKQLNKESQSEGQKITQKTAKKAAHDKNDEETDDGLKKSTKQRTRRKQSIS